MLDTIALTLDQTEFRIREPERFSPSAKGLVAPPYYPLGSHAMFSCYLNPTKSDYKAGRYAPRLTLTKRKARLAGFAMTLRIEFSAPKLIFGNNFDELRSQDFERVLTTLLQCLSDVGVLVTEDTLRAAKVSAIHYSKNIAFTDYTNCSMVMSELDQIDLSQRLDLSHTDYRNEGHAIRYHANSFEVTFYDKMKDLQKAQLSEKRAIERDSAPQFDIFADRGSFPKQLEVLRMEVRLGNRTKIKAIIGKICADVEPTFAALFDGSIAKAVLLHFWSSVRKQLPLIDLAKNRRPEDILGDLAVHANGTARPGRLLQDLGAAILVGSVGFRGAGAVLSRHCSARSWQRYKLRLKSPLSHKAVGFSALGRVDECLSAFKALRLLDFQSAPTPSSITAKPAIKRRTKHV
jgi:hypothetical protein